MRARIGVASVLFLGLVTTACEKRTPSPGPSASARPSASRPAVPPPRVDVEKIEVSLCRVIAVRPLGDGSKDAGADASAPAMGTPLEGRDWLDLPGKVELTLRHSATTRELALRGPGRFLPCFLGTETVLIARGGVKTTAGAGARAGAEVILATPFGTLHFADAALELEVGERGLSVESTTGSVALVPSAPASDAGPSEQLLRPNQTKRLSGKAEPGELVARCRETASTLGEEPPHLAGAPSARARLAEWSVARLRTRQRARFACAAARAAVGRQEAAERERLWTELATVDRVWKIPAGSVGN
jgi:hypothetical protein